MRPLLTFACSLLLQFTLWAQDDVPPVKLFEKYQGPNAGAPDTPEVAQNAISRHGDVRVFVDPKIEQLMQLHGEHKHVVSGYRVQIFLGDRRIAEETKRAFLQKYPDIPAYISWLAPNFRLRVGNLRTRLEAENLLKQLRTEHPGSYIVPDEIETRKP